MPPHHGTDETHLLQDCLDLVVLGVARELARLVCLRLVSSQWGSSVTSTFREHLGYDVEEATKSAVDRVGFRLLRAPSWRISRVALVLCRDLPSVRSRVDDVTTFSGHELAMLIRTCGGTWSAKELDLSEGTAGDDADLAVIAGAFPSVTSLDITDCVLVTTVAPFAPQLKEVDVSGCCGVGDDGLAEAHMLEALWAGNNTRVTSVGSFARTLTFLDASAACGINESALAEATSLSTLYLDDNDTITTLLPFGKNLTELNITGPDCSIGDEALAAASPPLTTLHVEMNATVTSVAFCAETLTDLNASGRIADMYDKDDTGAECRLGDEGLRGVHHLTRLNASDNANISTVQPFGATLTKLDASGLCGIGDGGLINATAITNLNADNNSRISSTAPFAASLTKLSASGEECGIGDPGLVECTALTSLNCSFNVRISTVAPFGETLRVLRADFTTALGDEGLRTATAIETLVVNGNRRVTTVAPFAETLTDLYAYSSCGITDVGLVTARHLTRLNVWNNPLISSVAPFGRTLTSLNASGSCGIGDETLRKATRLRVLNASLNNRITSVSPAFADSLTSLHAEGRRCGITDNVLWPDARPALQTLKVSGNDNVSNVTIVDVASSLTDLEIGKCPNITSDGLAFARHLRRLTLADNEVITSLGPGTSRRSLEYLDVTGRCACDNDSIAVAQFLIELVANNNPRVTSLEPFRCLLDVEAMENSGIGPEAVALLGYELRTLENESNMKFDESSPHGDLFGGSSSSASSGFGDCASQTVDDDA